MSAEDLVFGMWAQTFGAYSIIATSDALYEHGIREPFRAVRYNIHMMLDGYGWTPLSSETDYLELFETLQHEVFPNESQSVAV